MGVSIGGVGLGMGEGWPAVGVSEASSVSSFDAISLLGSGAELVAGD